ncbi:hypothetical protein IJH24_00430 [Candidatus Saccharibacteria bacterium]|nr:hypothetical protein [Candidatus Saccharibacteria bacterium]
MSILQDYEEQINFLGQETIDAISEYLTFLRQNGTTILYSDIIYKKSEWQKFDNWRKRVYNIKYGRNTKGD